MDASAGPAWSDAVGEADWIGERLSPFGVYQVTSVVPGGFDAYARVLHPAEEPEREGARPVRWSEVAAWSGMPLRRDAQFHSIALPLVRPERQAPWSGQGPWEGSLYLPDAEALAGLVREWTATPGRCWFCAWDGYGWDGMMLTTAGEPSMRLPDPVPWTIRRGPRVRLPNRDYLLYTGPVEAVAAVAPLSGAGQTPNLWWPADHAWCVSTEIDLPWTYVGGPAGLIERILDDERIEALPASPGDPLTRVEEWVTTWVDEAMTRLLSDGETVISTSRGTVHARLTRPSRFRRGGLWTRTQGDNGGSGDGWVGLSGRSEEELRDEISHYLAHHIIGLAGR
ncbi:MAG: hypothetical protein J2P35_02995 [Actinobacteria bacterium]|nr:hypothetical protein [Actinomycetota bacterium]MBO0785368.1 hypothetical protein [Actinomycetota bacterium]